MSNEEKEIGIVGLGKMGAGIALQLQEKGWKVSGYDPSAATMESLAKEGIETKSSLKELVDGLSSPKLVWVMVPARAPGAEKNAPSPVDEVISGKGGLTELLSKGDVVIDGGNSYFKEAEMRADKLAKHGITFIDVGFSGGPKGARNGGCLMIGGDQATFKAHEALFRDLALKDGYQFFSGAGAGHFVKMVHNGIEYGMMQALGEGFEILKKSPYRLDLTRVTDIYNHGSVIESRLVGWLKSAFAQYGEDLEEVSSTVGHLGEGEWTAKTAHEMGIEAKIIEGSFQFRVDSAKKPSFTGKVVSALRNQFGGHSIKSAGGGSSSGGK
ncbi:decarboxylating 6-phosphogluconate dehydrogenase [Candidatus Kaiserbacteria bacterium]|nr:decarboxylating 6-phosphogluconate dehydrogenase [Candidatus Kaiserbacteria bacterium]